MIIRTLLPCRWNPNDNHDPQWRYSLDLGSLDADRSNPETRRGRRCAFMQNEFETHNVPPSRVLDNAGRTE